MNEDQMPLRGEHVINLRISWELKSQLVALAKTEYRSLSEVCRLLLILGIPILEGLARSRTRAIKTWQAGNVAETPLHEELSGECNHA